MPTSRTLKLAAIGTAGGAFSGLLGVGGGSVIVPLLIVWLGYGAREATGTSMMAIVVIAAVAVTLQAFYGNVDPPNAALVGIAGNRRGGRRHRPAAAHPGAGDLPALRRPPRHHRRQADHLVSSIAAAIMGFAGGLVGGLLGVGGGHPLRAGTGDLHGRDAGPRGGDLAAGDRPGRAGGRLASARLRERPGARRARDRGAVAGRGGDRRGHLEHDSRARPGARPSRASRC